MEEKEALAQGSVLALALPRAGCSLGPLSSVIDGLLPP